VAFAILQNFVTVMQIKLAVVVVVVVRAAHAVQSPFWVMAGFPPTSTRSHVANKPCVSLELR